MKHQKTLTLLLISLFFFSMIATIIQIPEVHATSGITREQGNARGTSTGSSISVTMASTPVAGDVLIATVGDEGIPVTSISQTGVTWTMQVKSYIMFCDDIEIWAGIVGSGASTSITVNLIGAATSGAVADVCEYKGIITSGFLDKTATNVGGCDTGTTATTTLDNELWIGAVMVVEGGDQESPAYGFSLLDGVVYTEVSVGYLEKMVTSTGTAHSYTYSSGGDDTVGCIATFKSVCAITVNSAYGSPTSSGTVAIGGNFPTSVTSPESLGSGHQVVCVGYIIDSGSLTAGVSYEFTIVQADHTITYYWQEQFYLTVSSSYGTPSGAGWYNSGATAYAGLDTNTVSGGTGIQYVFTSWSSGGTNYAQSTGITMSSAISTTANWQTQYYLTVSSSYGSPQGEGWYNSGVNAPFNVTTPASGGTGVQYVFSSYSGSGTGSYTGSTLYSSVTMNNAITETPIWVTQYLISPSNDSHSAITPSTATWVNSGDSQYFNYSASLGYTIQYCLVDGSSVTVTGDYTFTNVLSPHSIEVTTSSTVFGITATCDLNSAISPSGIFLITYGSNQAFIFSANSGYSISYVLVDGSYVSTTSPYSFTNVIANHTIAVFSATPLPSPSATPTPGILPATLNVAPFWQYIFAGNLLGWFQAIYVSAFGLQDILYGAITMLFLVPIYLKTKSLWLLCVLWILIGGFALALAPAVSAFAVLFLCLGIAGIFWKLVKPD